MSTGADAHHTTFVIERQLAASPQKVFRSWSDREAKARWNGCHPDWMVLEDRFDFRVGGEEVKRWRLPGGVEQTFEARYFDIEPVRRIIYGFDMTLGGARVSVSLVTIEFKGNRTGTHMLYTEQMAHLGDSDARHQRVKGTGTGFDRLVREMQRQPLRVLPVSP